MAKLRIAFSGIGAVGGYYGGMVMPAIENNKSRYLFIARGKSKAIRENGFNATRHPDNPWALATDNPAEIGPVDYLFIVQKLRSEENIHS